MIAQTTYFRVGIFVLVAMALLVAAVIVFSVGTLQERETVLFETYFDESVQGLEEGSKVKMKGVEIGLVERISFVDAEYEVSREFSLEHGRYILVRMAGYVDRLPKGAATENLAEAVEAGWRVRLASQGVTGVKYVDADMLDPERHPPLEIEWEPKHPYIPSAPGMMAAIGDAIEDIGDLIESINLEQLLEDTHQLLTTSKDQIAAVDVEGLNEKLGALLDDARRLASNPDIADSLENVHGMTESGRDLLARFESQLTEEDLAEAKEQLHQIGGRLSTTIDKLDQILTHLDSALVDQQYNLGRTIYELRLTLENLRELTDTAKKYPSWMIFGEPPPQSQPQGKE
jgi:ABC-type transporter Mla subunit MlaD